MVLVVVVILGTLIAWAVILTKRAKAGLPLTETICERAFFAALEFGGAVIGAALPILWIIGANSVASIRTGTVRFAFPGNLPPGVEEQDLLGALVVGTIILLIRGFFRYRTYLRDRDPGQ